MKKRYIAATFAFLALCLLLRQLFHVDRPVVASPGPIPEEEPRAAIAPAPAAVRMGTDLALPVQPDAAASATEEQDLEGLPACPSAPPKNRTPCDAVEYAVRTCAYASGADELVCDCTTNGGHEAVWQCRYAASNAPEILCPPSTPTAGAVCPVADQSCLYGEGPTANFCRCQGDPAPRWKCQPYSEVYPLPK